MFAKILVAIDTSSMGNYVFEQALELAKAVKGHLLLLHVLSPEEDTSPGMPGFAEADYYPWTLDDVNVSYRKQWDEFESECLEILQARTHQAMQVGVSAEFTQVPGSPGEIICKMAQTLQADLIILGHRGLSGLSELILGSVSNYVLHHAPCSVLTVQLPIVKTP